MLKLDTLSFVKHHIGGVQSESSDSAYISQLKDRIRDLEFEVDDLKSKVKTSIGLNSYIDTCYDTGNT